MAVSDILLAVVAAAVPVGALAATTLSNAPTETSQPATSFDRLARMEGIWRPAHQPDSPLRIEFTLTARGSVIVERWTVRGKPHSLTVYHRDGARLMATHYCPQGNQPRLVASGRADERLRFTYLDATDFDATTEAVQHELWFDLADPEHPVRGEIYRSGGVSDSPDEMRLVRVAPLEADAGKSAGT